MMTNNGNWIRAHLLAGGDGRSDYYQQHLAKKQNLSAWTLSRHPVKLDSVFGQNHSGQFSRGVLLLATCLTLGANFTASARVFIVTNTNDSIGIESLRGAIVAANRDDGKDTIYLCGTPWEQRGNRKSRQVFQLNIAGADETNSLTGDLDITRGDLNIIGASPNVTIDASGLGDRIFQVFSKAHLTLENLTLIGGNTIQGTNTQADNSRGGNGEDGGCILNSGRLNLVHCSIIGNSCGGGGIDQWREGGDGGNGGGIYNSGKMTLLDCVVSGNRSGTGDQISYLAGNGGLGGGVFNSGVMTMNDCTIGNNACGAGGNNERGFLGDGGSAGGVFNLGQFSAQHCLIEKNAAGDGGGAQGLAGNGGGFVNAGISFLTRCVIAGNRAGNGGGQPYHSISGGGPGGDGGGLCNFGALVLKDCSVCSNYSGFGANGGNFIVAWTGGPGTHGGSGGNGGGIFNTNMLTLIGCSVWGNNSGTGGVGGDGIGSFSGANGGAGGNGGGIFNSAILEITNCTISGNFCGNGGNGGAGTYSDNGVFYPPTMTQGGNGGSGGGIYSHDSLQLTSCSVVDNTSGAEGTATVTLTNGESIINAGTRGLGGGVFNGGGIAFCANSLFALNAMADETGSDAIGNFNTQGFNLISIGNGSIGFTNGVEADQVGNTSHPINPNLGTLQMNGGFTPTHALLWGSPAIDQGNDFGIHADQRGHHRPYNFPSIPSPQGGDGSDIGAFELNAKPSKTN